MIITSIPRTLLAILAGALTVPAAASADDWPQEIQSGLGMEFVLIPAGEFQMGVKRGGTAAPPHFVTITKPFYMGKHEVTQGQWEAVMGSNPSHFGTCGENCPVENVSWVDVQEFIKKLNETEGTDKYRLPTEAEWEYAARAGSEDARYGPTDEIAWHRGNNQRRAHPVGGKLPNEWGLYDTLGNVSEWVQDWYGPYSREPQTDPTGPQSGKWPVRRGYCGLGTRFGRAGCRVWFRTMVLIPGSSSETSEALGQGRVKGNVSVAVSIGDSMRGAVRREQSTKATGFRLARSVGVEAEPAQRVKKALTNEEIILAVQSELPEEIILARIEASACEFDLSIEALAALHEAGVPKAVIAAMIGCEQ